MRKISGSAGTPPEDSESAVRIYDRGPILARFARPAGPRTTLAVVADPHISTDATGTWKLFHRTEARLRAAIRDANRLGVDGAIFLGDLTKDGAPDEFARVDDLLSELRVPFVAVPGNHDVQKTTTPETPPIAAFEAAYTPGSLPFCVRIGGIDLIGLNSASMPDGSLSDTHAGAISTSQLSWLDATLSKVENPVVTLHHTVSGAPRYLSERGTDEHFRIRNPAALVDILDTHDVGVVLSGHTHWPAVTLLGRTYELTAPAACSFPQAWLLVSIEPQGTTVSLLPLADRKGYEEAHRYASRGKGRGPAMTEHVEGGYFSSFPLVDEVESPPIDHRRRSMSGITGLPRQEGR